MTINAFAHVREWVFDLDNTLYAAGSVYDDVGARMTAYITRETGWDLAHALVMQERYFHQYGASVTGLALHHQFDAEDFLAQVHDVDLSSIEPDPALGALIAALPGRKFVHTNGGGGHAERVLARLELTHVFDGVMDISGAGLSPKPQPEAYERLIAAFDIDPQRAAFIEDTLRNLEPAHALGFATALVGPVHPDPSAPYVDAHAHDVKALLRAFL